MRILITISLLFINLNAGTYSGGSGTSADPYLISTLADLAELAQTTADWDRYFSQTQTIDASQTQYWDDSDDDPDGNRYNDPEDATSSGNNAGFPGIGTAMIWFDGAYNGNDHYIQNLTIDRPTTDYVGLFTKALRSPLQNIQLSAMDITGRDHVGGVVGYFYADGAEIMDNCRTTGSLSGVNRVGGVVGENSYGTINNCSSSATITTSGDYTGGVVGRSIYSTSVLSECNSSASINASGDYAGGLVGEVINDGKVTNGYSSGSVSGNFAVGGLVGVLDFRSEISASFATGDVTASDDHVGGLVGANRTGSTIKNSYARGNVNGTGSNRVGGLAGLNYGTSSSTASIVNCYSTGAVSGSSDMGGLVAYQLWGSTSNSFWDTQTSGVSSSASGTGKTTSEMTDFTTFTNAGWDFVTESTNGTDDYWDADQTGTVNNGYPTMSYQDGADRSLPVTLTEFVAEADQDEVTLIWRTSSEIENLGFILERSEGQSASFTELAAYSTHAALVGQGSTTQETRYSFTDRDIELGQTYRYRLSDVSYKGVTSTHPLAIVAIPDDEQQVLHDQLTVELPYPNPFNPITTISYQLPAPARVRLSVHDMTGRLVTTLRDRDEAAGYYDVQWNARDATGNQVSTGVYLCRLQAGDHSKTIKLMYLK